jgi:hypothetical protein
MRFIKLTLAFPLLAIAALGATTYLLIVTLIGLLLVSGHKKVAIAQHIAGLTEHFKALSAQLDEAKKLDDVGTILARVQ